MTQRVRYHCQPHGAFFADVPCGRDHGPAPDRIGCPKCGRLALRRSGTRDRGCVSVSADTYDRLKAFCDRDGLAMSALIETLTKDIQ